MLRLVPKYSNMQAPPIIFAMIDLFLQPRAESSFTSRGKTVSAYFPGLSFLPALSGSMICTIAPSFRFGSNIVSPMQEPRPMVIIGKEPMRSSPIPIIDVCSFLELESGITGIASSAGFHHIFKKRNDPLKSASLRHHNNITVYLVFLAGSSVENSNTSLVSSCNCAISDCIAACAISIVSAGGEGSITKPSSSAVASRNAETMILPTSRRALSSISLHRAVCFGHTEHGICHADCGFACYVK